MRHLKTALTALALAAAHLPVLAAGIPVKLHKNPGCYCCDLYARHLEENGFAVEIIGTTDMASVHRQYGVPEQLEGCHTAVIGKYVVEGHVPAQYVHRLLTEHSAAKGLSVPGMPVGTPGMPGAKSKPLNVYVFGASAAPRVFATF